jgi:hypothetical protein
MALSEPWVAGGESGLPRLLELAYGIAPVIGP